ncbi:hypothetical protein M406DRAFT_324229 [Cryphonectria parasitica EP155]|uniref:Uncharacterized protein n=1 Tax=Cryphonectria parasitica (strain ATCC 38755 / EP155) TaxID=660469 RepID=A0A9P4XVT9_CRYP1|nr:uncharacterized protein M406DRAFT_324229 [Cryphonectria parasitica EP155]KAF3761771.1 hypothetical protein M406DRAFT_324229 [Cryphonectria parasitica EP155]
MAELWAHAEITKTTSSAALYATPPESPRHKYSHSRSSSRDTRYTADSMPGLESSSSSSSARSISSSPSYDGYTASLNGSTGATTPPSETGVQDPYFYSNMDYADSSYDPPVEIIVAQQQQQKQNNTKVPYYHDQELPELPRVPQLAKQKSLLPYEISPDELRELETGVTGAKRSRVRGMFGRIFSSGSGVAAR